VPDIASQAIPEFPALRIRPFANDRRLARRQAVHRQPSDLSAEGQPVRAPSLRRPFSSVEVAHLDVADLVGVEVHLGHLREDEVQELGAVEATDLGVEVELLDDVAGVGVEGGDPGAQVAGDLAGVGQDGPQVQARGVVGLDAGHGLEDGAHGLDGESLDAGEDLGLGGLEDAVEAAEQDERQDDAAVFGSVKPGSPAVVTMLPYSALTVLCRRR